MASKLLALGLLLSCLISAAQAALVGYGIYPYRPSCAFSCLRSFDSLMLTCSGEMSSAGMMMGSSMTTPQCRAKNTPWLASLAWCLHDKCAPYNLPVSELEDFWEKQSTEDASVAPKWGYSVTLVENPTAPTTILNASAEYLNETSLVNDGVYEAQYNILTAVARENKYEAAFGIAILVSAFAIPIALTWLGYIPYASRLLDRLKPRLIYPSLIGTYHVRPLPYNIGNAPTLGQTLYIAGFIVLNIVLTAVAYRPENPQAWFSTFSNEVLAFVFYRTGVFAFVLLPLLLLFSSRNNILLWLTNWSHATFLLLHRWVARVFALHVLLHTLLALPLYYPADAKEQYWIWGAVATIAVMILAFASGLHVRRPAYEFFLISHIVLAVIVIVGCWYHVKLWIGLTWGYETWLYAACAVWFFDRLLRVGRILHTGRRRCKVTELGGDYVRVDIPGVRWGAQPGKHVYVYFPTLSPLRPWENHPFSVIPTVLLQQCHSRPASVAAKPSPQQDNVDIEKDNKPVTQTMPISKAHPEVGLSFFIKKAQGVTKYLKASDDMLTLLDGPYPNNPTKEVLRCDRLLLIGGGIGITSLLPWVSCHWNVKLCWSVKESAKCLVEALDGALAGIEEKDIRIGHRLDVEELLAQEQHNGCRRIGVVVSGPGGLCDHVRAAVVEGGKAGDVVFELEVDAYSW